MTKIFSFLLLTLFLIPETMEAQENTPIITGILNDTLFQTEWYAQWNDARDYQLNPEILKQLEQQQAEDLHFIVYLGTWCGDSRKHVPVFLELANKLKWKVSLIGVNREKECPLDKKACKSWDIEYLPTFVVKRGDKEIGRIVETPAKSVEEDLLELLRK